MTLQGRSAPGSHNPAAGTILFRALDKGGNVLWVKFQTAKHTARESPFDWTHAGARFTNVSSLQATKLQMLFVFD